MHLLRWQLKANADKKLYTGATRVLRRLSGRTGLFFLQDFLTPDVVVDSASLVIESKRKVKVELAEDESYMLWVSTSGILLKAETDIGTVRGLETFLQLLSVDDQG